jgi:hypothetical protein
MEQVGSVEPEPNKGQLLGLKEELEVCVFGKTDETLGKAKALRFGVGVGRGYFWTDFHEWRGEATRAERFT